MISRLVAIICIFLIVSVVVNFVFKWFDPPPAANAGKDAIVGNSDYIGDNNKNHDDTNDNTHSGSNTVEGKDNGSSLNVLQTRVC